MLDNIESKFEQVSSLIASLHEENVNLLLGIIFDGYQATINTILNCSEDDRFFTHMSENEFREVIYGNLDKRGFPHYLVSLTTSPLLNDVSLHQKYKFLIMTKRKEFL